MNQIQSFADRIQPREFAIYALAGAAIAFGAISVFVFGIDHPDPNWPENWRARPLLVTPLAGAAGGAFLYFITRLRFESQGLRLLAMLLGMFGFVVALWVGIVLGLDGTMWD